MIVLWRVTTRCDYACGFCLYDRRLRGQRSSVDAAEALRFGRLLAAWSQARGERMLLSWLGGEPLLWRPIWALSRALSAAGVAISATTNGSTLHLPAVQAALARDFAELTVSVDGPAAVHDRLRGRTGAFARVETGVTALAARGTGLRLRANVVLMQDTIDHFASLCRTLGAWGVAEITFNQLGGRDRPAFFPAQRLRPADVARLATILPDLRAELAAGGVTLCGDARYLARLDASAAGRPIAVDDCAPGQAFLFVDEQGMAAPCSFSGETTGVPIASLRTVADLDALPARFAAARTMRRPAACADCPSTQAFAKFAA